jgi:hypothetical protein
MVQVGPWEKVAPAERRHELPWLIGASLMVVVGLILVLVAKTSSFRETSERLQRGELLNLNAVTAPEQVAPFLQVFTDPAERDLAAEKIASYVRLHKPLANVGALARMRVSRQEIENEPRWRLLRDQLRQQIASQQHKLRHGDPSVPLVPLARLKPALIVRTPREFLTQFAAWIALYLASFFAVHLVWRWRGFRGDAAILPAVHLLTGIGLILAVSLRDPLRDTLEFRKFAWGVALGCVILLLPAFRLFDYRRFSRWIYTPLLASFLLFVLLLALGSGRRGAMRR